MGNVGGWWSVLLVVGLELIAFDYQPPTQKPPTFFKSLRAVF